MRIPALGKEQPGALQRKDQVQTDLVAKENPSVLVQSKLGKPVVSPCCNHIYILIGLQRRSTANGPRASVIPLHRALVRLHLRYALLGFGLPIGEIV